MNEDENMLTMAFTDIIVHLAERRLSSGIYLALKLIAKSENTLNGPPKPDFDAELVGNIRPSGSIRTPAFRKSFSISLESLQTFPWLQANHDIVYRTNVVVISKLSGPIALARSIIDNYCVHGLWLGHTGTFMHETSAWSVSKGWITLKLIERRAGRSPSP